MMSRETQLALSKSIYAKTRNAHDAGQLMRFLSSVDENFNTPVENEIAAIRDAGHTVACKIGCDHCCYQGVWALPHEVLRIASYLVDTLSGGELVTMKRKVSGRSKLDEGTPMDFRFWSCPLLDRQRCMVYDIRPNSCAAANSADVAPCRKAVEGARKKRESPNVPTYAPPGEVATAIRFGIVCALNDLGLYIEFVELNAGLIKVIDSPAQAWERWLSGEAVFDKAPMYKIGRFAGQADAPTLKEMAEMVAVQIRH